MTFRLAAHCPKILKYWLHIQDIGKIYLTDGDSTRSKELITFTNYCAMYRQCSKHNVSRSFTPGYYIAAQKHATLKSVRTTFQVHMVNIFVFKLQNIKTTNVTTLARFCGYQFHRNLTNWFRGP